MADVAKLKKQLSKADSAVETARETMTAAIDGFASAHAARAVIHDQLEQAQALETALELRAKKAG
jgi:hypothetical protein